MHYPWWSVDLLTAPMLIAVISVVHVLVSHYAVGGGFFLAFETGYAYRTHNQNYLAYLKRHAAFFILLTVVFGAITGVGIWWTIGLASPKATELLIRIFVFGWATEWVFFVLELASAFIFYYLWGQLTPRIHVIVGWIYALSAWISLVIITGITAFMLHPGQWLETKNFWSAFFNPQFLPQTVARTGGMLLLSSLYVYLHASLTIRDPELRDRIGSRSTRPALVGSILITIGGVAWYMTVPESAQAVLASAAVLNILMALIFGLTAGVFFLLYFGPYRNPGWMTPGFAIALFLFGTAAFSTGEFIREAVRKPYIIYNVVFGNQITPDQVPVYREKGYLESGLWTRAYVAKHYPQAVANGRIDENKLLALPAGDRARLGEVLFMYHCNDCHASQQGYSAVALLLVGKPRSHILSTVEHLEKAHFIMPPWAGTLEEAELLTDYLLQIAPERPKGMRLGINGPRDATEEETH